MVSKHEITVDETRVQGIREKLLNKFEKFDLLDFFKLKTNIILGLFTFYVYQSVIVVLKIQFLIFELWDCLVLMLK